MAISNADGSIVLTTRVDESGIKKWFESVKNGTNQATEATKKYERQATQSGEKVKLSFDDIGKSIQKIASYLGIAFGIKAFVQFSNASANMATQTEASVQRLVDIYGEASGAVGDFIDQNARALGMSKSAAASFSSVYGNLFSVWADQATNAKLTNRYLQTTAVVASKTGRTVEDVQERIRSGLLGNTEAIEDLGIFVNVKTIEMTDAFQRMADGKSWEQLDAYTQQQIRAMAILEQATAKYGDEVADTSATIRNRFNAAYQDFQNSWGTIVNQVLLPVLQVLTEIFNIATAGLNALSGSSGKILEATDVTEENSEKTADNINKQTDAQKDLNKELKKATASFDDIEILSSNTANNLEDEDNKNNLDNLIIRTGEDFGEIAPDGSAYVDEVDETLTAIMGIVVLSLAAVGLILLFTGNIGWGIGFIIAGAATLTVTMATASKFGYDGIIQMLTTIMGVAGGALLALGIILLWIGGVVGTPIAIGMIIAGGALIVSAVAAQAAFSPDDIGAWLSIILGIAGGALLALGIILVMVGSVPLGVGMIIAGAVSLVSAVDLNFDFIVEAIKGPIGAIMALVGGALLVIGIILVCTGAALPLAIGLIAVGAASLAAPLALNWNGIVDNIKNFLFENPLLVSLISGGLLVLGIILCFAQQWALGIGLIAIGAIGLAAEVALHWDAIVTNIKNFLFENSKLISLISGGLLILGILLCVTGVGLPLGIALIAAGAVGLVTIAALNSDAIVDWVKGAWNAVKAFWNKYIAPIFTKEWWLNLAKQIGNGLITGFENAINGIISLFEKMINWVVGALNKISFDVPDWVPLIGGKTFGFNIPEVKFGRVSIPRLAQGAVIPPNREFLAVLGDQKQGVNIETPLSTMVEAFQMALDSRGGYNGGNTEVVLEIDGREFGRAVVEQGNRENRRIGTRLVIA